MGNQRILDLHWRDPLAAHLEHIIRTASIPVETVFILIILIASVNPVAINRVFGLFVLVPILRSDAVATNQQVADIALWHGLPCLVGNHCLIAGYQLARTAGANLTGAIADKDVEYLG